MTDKDNFNVSELLNRVSNLEHLYVSSNLNTALQTSSANPDTSLLNYHDLISRVSQLEELLTASELENQKLLKQFHILQAAKNREQVVLFEQIDSKDVKVKELQNSVCLLEVKKIKLEKKLKATTDYVNELPSHDELNEAKYKISQLELKNQFLQDKIENLTVCKSTLEIKFAEKERAYNNALIKLEELKPYEEARKSMIENKFPCNLSDEASVIQVLEIQKGEIIKTCKLVESLKKKLSHVQEEKTNVIQELYTKKSEVESLNNQIIMDQMKNDQLAQCLKKLEEERNHLKTKVEQLQLELNKSDEFHKLRDQQMSNLIRLVTEIEICIGEVRKLVQLGQSIANKDDGELPVECLIGFCDELDLHLDSDASSSSATGNFNPTDMEWSLNKLKKVYEIRQEIGLLRSQITDSYAEMLGSKINGCPVQ